MIDLRTLRDDPEFARDAQRRRGLSPDLVDEVLAADESRRNTIAEFERLRAEQKAIGRDVSQASGDDREKLLERTRELSQRVKEADAAQAAAEESFYDTIIRLPNLASPEAPAGGEDDFVLLEEIGTPRDFAAEGFEPLDHIELGKVLGAIDTERGAKVSGARFYYLTGVGAMLELALVQMAMERAQAAGHTPMIPPALVKPRAMEGTGFLGQAAQDVYHLPDDDLYLVGTSEVPLAAYHSDEILNGADLPLRYAAFSPCYRREAGSYGKDTKGIFR
ncbi:MAG TPA: aminoacyl--tRNA ligase-related protein, partial [Nocardioidaceae bacterium]|nr:aminoacyl--tRNA ligase-related protein [Nocardioidaceae bacterium]